MQNTIISLLLMAQDAKKFGLIALVLITLLGVYIVIFEIQKNTSSFKNPWKLSNLKNGTLLRIISVEDDKVLIEITEDNDIVAKKDRWFFLKEIPNTIAHHGQRFCVLFEKGKTLCALCTNDEEPKIIEGSIIAV
jgi:hypothetical protein